MTDKHIPTLRLNDRGDAYQWNDPAWQTSDTAVEIQLRKQDGQWQLMVVYASEGAIVDVVQRDVDPPSRETGCYQSDVECLLEVSLGEMRDESRIRTSLDAHPLARGLRCERNGRVDELALPSTSLGLGKIARSHLEGLAAFDWLNGLERITRSDHGRLYLRADDAGAQRHLGSKIPAGPEGWDLILVVREHGMVAEKGYHLAPDTGFDTETDSLTGVGPAYDLDGRRTYCEDIWCATTIIRRLPPADWPEDIRYRIDRALDRVMDPRPDRDDAAESPGGP
ncbi:hypothetical protein OCH239_09725 [Roseivivax halodurans JCM 10272]|uniref:Uncharacterized protein n=1 Tax=Roseivivax halodurans JCM 10272 TaxID=1449350 RepID=X7EEK1_9RHOB|nr:hypothetical protein [Roseivivax halodurans]ETX13548.1 hypothetical protein OCH239_09725 [Roseivivax halodurans JCM 10272]